MAGVEDTASLAAAETEISQDAVRRFDVAFRGGAAVFSILVVLIAWEVFARSGKVTAFMLPPFSAVAERIYADAISGALWRNLSVTMLRALTGFFIAAAGGIALGAAMALNQLGIMGAPPLLGLVHDLSGGYAALWACVVATLALAYAFTARRSG